jgi:hypothetical protein
VYFGYTAHYHDKTPEGSRICHFVSWAVAWVRRI